VLIDARTFVLN